MHIKVSKGCKNVLNKKYRKPKKKNIQKMEGMKDLFDHTLLNLSLTHSRGTLTSQFGLSCWGFEKKVKETKVETSQNKH